MDVETLLASGTLPEVDVDTDRALTSTTARGRRRTRRRVGATGALGVLVVALLVGTIVSMSRRSDGADVTTGPVADEPAIADEGTWTPMSTSPLSARDQGVAAWTGSEVVIVGGSSTTPCGSASDCLVDLEPLADGAAYHPATDAWRRIADAPIPFVRGFATWTGSDLLVLAQQELGGPEALLRYEPGSDRWTNLAAPPVPGFRSMAWTGDAWVGAHPGVGSPAELLWRYRPAIDSWEAFGGALTEAAPELRDHQVIWTGTDLVLLGSRWGTDPPNGYWEAGVLTDVGDWRWSEPSDIVNNGGTWVAHDGRAVNLSAIPVRDEPTGGIFDPAAGAWSHLPEGPPSAVDGRSEGTGYHGAAGPWVVSDDRLYDPASETWRAVPPRPGRSTHPEPPDSGTPGWPMAWPAVAVWTGTEVVSWGGRVEVSPTAGVALDGTGARYRPPAVGGSMPTEAPSGSATPPGSTTSPGSPAPTGSAPAAGSASRVVVSEAEPGDPATWRTDPDAPPDPRSTSITALVTRLGCASGETGPVLRPGVLREVDRITITFTVEAIHGFQDCQGNPEVRYVVDLGEPLGDRELVDGGCTDEAPRGQPSCPTDDGLRWRPTVVTSPGTSP